MKVTIERERLLDALSGVLAAVETSTASPMLGYVKLTVGDGRLWLLATDMEVFARARVETPTSTEREEMLLPAKTLHGILRRCTGETVTLRDEGTTARVESGKYSASLYTMPVEDYPTMPEPEEADEVEVESGPLLRAIRQTVFAGSNDPARYSLEGIRLEATDSGLTLIATDGHRMAVAEIGSNLGLPGEGIIIPRKGAMLMAKLMEAAETVHMRAEPKTIWVQGDGRRLAIQLTGGGYPDWRAVLPDPDDERHTTTAHVHRESLVAALERVSVLAGSTSAGVQFSFREEQLTLALSSERGEAVDEIDCLLTGEPVEARYNVRYWLEPLRVMESERVRVRLTSEDGVPCLITGEDDPGYRYAVMAMRSS